MNIAWGKLAFSSFGAWILAAIFSLYYLSPLVIPGSESKPLKFGIDLVGGTYISLIVDTDKAVEDSLYEQSKAIVADLKHAKLEVPTKTDVQGN